MEAGELQEVSKENPVIEMVHFFSRLELHHKEVEYEHKCHRHDGKAVFYTATSLMLNYNSSNAYESDKSILYHHDLVREGQIMVD